MLTYLNNEFNSVLFRFNYFIKICLMNNTSIIVYIVIFNIFYILNAFFYKNFLWDVLVTSNLIKRFFLNKKNL